MTRVRKKQFTRITLAAIGTLTLASAGPYSHVSQFTPPHTKSCRKLTD